MRPGLTLRINWYSEQWIQWLCILILRGWELFTCMKDSWILLVEMAELFWYSMKFKCVWKGTYGWWVGPVSDCYLGFLSSKTAFLLVGSHATFLGKMSHISRWKSSVGKKKKTAFWWLLQMKEGFQFNLRKLKMRLHDLHIVGSPQPHWLRELAHLHWLTTQSQGFHIFIVLHF